MNLVTLYNKLTTLPVDKIDTWHVTRNINNRFSMYAIPQASESNVIVIEFSNLTTNELYRINTYLESGEVITRFKLMAGSRTYMIDESVVQSIDDEYTHSENTRHQVTILCRKISTSVDIDSKQLEIKYPRNGWKDFPRERPVGWSLHHTGSRPHFESEYVAQWHIGTGGRL